MSFPYNIENTFLPVTTLKSLTKKPIRRMICNKPIVIWRANNEIKAAIDRCPHRNYPLSMGHIENGNLICPYHGWEFSQNGECQNVPGLKKCDKSKLGLEILEVKIQWGAVFVRLKSDKESPILAPMPDDNEFDHFWWELKPAKARVYDALDNVLDPFHTNFIHDGFIRVRSKRQKVLQEIEIFPDHLSATYIQDADFGAMSKFLEGKRTKSIGFYYPPVCFQGRWEGVRGLQHCVTIWFVPESENSMRSLVRFSMAKYKGPKWFKELMVRLFLIKVIEQDADALAKLADNIANFGAPHFKIFEADRLSVPFSKLYNGQKPNHQTLGPFEIYL
jgi:phenylpropionate dioxygenase-like ring-hydroxylating dioxygenase large terminal subunit